MSKKNLITWEQLRAAGGKPANDNNTKIVKIEVVDLKTHQVRFIEVNKAA